MAKRKRKETLLEWFNSPENKAARDRRQRDSMSEFRARLRREFEEADQEVRDLVSTKRPRVSERTQMMIDRLKREAVRRFAIPTSSTTEGET